MGRFKYWTDSQPEKKTIHNLIANEGHVAALDSLLQASGAIGTLYIGLITGGAGFPTPFQTLADKDWTEFTSYTEATRQKWNRAAVDGQTVPNEDCVPTVFTMEIDPTLQGFFITDTSAKGDTLGKLLAISDNSLSLTLYEFDRLYLEYTWEF